MYITLYGIISLSNALYLMLLMEYIDAFEKGSKSALRIN